MSEIPVEEILLRLTQKGGRFPEEELRTVQAHRELFIPGLIRLLEEATSQTRQGEPAAGNAQTFALFLLAEFQAREALPAIIAAISLPDEGPYELFGESLYDDIPRALEQLTDDHPEAVLDSLIADPSLRPIVCSAAAETYVRLVCHGRVTREFALERVASCFRAAVEDENVVLATYLLLSLHSLWPQSVLSDIERAYENHAIDSWMIDLGSIQESVACGEEAHMRDVASQLSPPITDAVSELMDILVPKPRPATPKYGNRVPKADWQPNRNPTRRYSKSDDEVSVDHAPAEVSSTIRRTTARVGRNDPCPCGSGKKFKKCCYPKN